MTVLHEANQALRQHQHERAIRLYVRALGDAPGLAAMVVANLRLARARHVAQRAEAARKRVAVCGWDLSHNAAGRVATLAQVHALAADVEIIGCLFPSSGRQVWMPVRNLGIPISTITVDDERGFVDQAIALVTDHPCDVLHVSKPRFPNLLIALLYKAMWGARVLVDIDDEELAFVGAGTPLALADLLQGDAAVPGFRDLAGVAWTRLAVGQADRLDAVTVANRALQQRYGGVIVRHARDADAFRPSANRRELARRRLGIRVEERVVVFLGTPRAHKGLREVALTLQALARPDVVMLVVGDFPADLAGLQRELETMEGLRLLHVGSQPFQAIADFLAAGDACVLLQDPDTPAARFQTPAKLSDALAMGVPVLARATPGLADLHALGAFQAVTRHDLGPALAAVLDRAGGPPAPHPVFEAELSLQANGRVLHPLLQGEAAPVPQDLAAWLATLDADPSLAALLAGEGRPRPLADDLARCQRLAEQAMAAGDWGEARRLWLRVVERPGSVPGALLLAANQRLFVLDDFGAAATALERASAAGTDPGAARLHGAYQHYYHCYSSWLMQVTEGEPEWFRADGLVAAPDWGTAIEGLRAASAAQPEGVRRHFVQALLLASERETGPGRRNAFTGAWRELLACIGAGAIPQALQEAVLQDALERLEAGHSPPALEEQLRDAVEALPPGHLSVGDWLCLHDALAWNGRFLVAAAARRRAIQQALAQAEAQPGDAGLLKLALRGALETGQTDRVEALRVRLRQAAGADAEAQELDACCDLAAGDLDGFRRRWPHAPTPADEAYAALVRGKRVAVVGPAPTGHECGAEIDACDVVIRFNHRGPGTLGDPLSVGTRTDCSLYNAHTIRWMLAHGTGGLLEELRCVLVRRPNARLPDLLRGRVPVRRLHERQPFYKSHNAMPALVFDLLLQGPASVKVFGSDLYAGGQHHHEGYRPNLRERQPALARLRPVMANHDLLGQLAFARQLAGAGLLAGCPATRQALALSDADYLARLQQRVDAADPQADGREALERRIEHALYLTAQRDLHAAHAAWERLLADAGADLPATAYMAHAENLRLMLRLRDSDTVLQQGILRYPEHLGLRESYAKNALDAKNWPEAAFRWLLIAERVDSRHRLAPMALRNIGVALGNQNDLAGCAAYFERYLVESGNPKLVGNAHFARGDAVADVPRGLRALCIFDDDSTMYVIAEVAASLEREGVEVTVAKLIHSYGSRTSPRQEAQALRGRPFLELPIAELGERAATSPALAGQDALVFAKPMPIAADFYLDPGRPCVVTLYMGVDFFPVTGIVNRATADVICFNTRTEQALYEQVLPAALRARTRTLVYSPKFAHVPRARPAREVRKVYFLAQAIVPLAPAARRHVLELVNACARHHPQAQVVIKLRHLEDENKSHAHKELHPYQDLAAGMALEPNVAFSVQGMDEVVADADFCITCSSTAGIETALLDIPTLFYMDYPQAADDPLTAKSLEFLAGSQLLCTADDVVALRRKVPAAAWLANLRPDPGAVRRLAEAIAGFRAGAPAAAGAAPAADLLAA